MTALRRRAPSTETDDEPDEALDDDIDLSGDDDAAPRPRGRSKSDEGAGSNEGVRRARRAIASAPIARSDARTDGRNEGRIGGRGDEPTRPAANVARIAERAPTAQTKPIHYGRPRELGALLLVSFALFFALALGSYDLTGGSDWVGPVGARVAGMGATALGVVAWAIPVEMILFSLPFLRGTPSVVTAARLAGDVVLGVTASALVHVGAAGRPVFGGHPAAGAIGELFGELSRALFSTIGTFLVGFTTVGLVLVTRATFSFIAFANRAGEAGAVAANGAAASMRGVADAWNQAKALERGASPAIVGGGLGGMDDGHDHNDDAIDRGLDSDARFARASIDDSGIRSIVGAAEIRVRKDERVSPEAHAIARQLAGIETRLSEPQIAMQTSPRPAVAASSDLSEIDPILLASGVDAAGDVVEGPSDAVGERPTRNRRGKSERSREPMIAPPAPEAAVQRSAERAAAATKSDEEAAEESDLPAAVEEDAPPPSTEGDVSAEDALLTRDAEAAPSKPPSVTTPPTKQEPTRTRVVPAVHAGFRLPTTDFLAQPPADQPVVDRELLLKDADALVKTLATYKVAGEVREIHPGPVVTTFEFEPTIGTKVRAVESLAADLRLSLAKESVRIVAPIPGKNRIGFELPNLHRVPVNFRELIEDRRFLEQKGALPIVLGRDIVGAPAYADLATMPHLLVAGATGAGKSVGLNVMLTSLLYRRTPEDLRMIMIDPKVVELAPFDRIPHMLLPVVTDMKQALNALKWCVDEMERRYQLLAQAGVKNIVTYDAWRTRVIKGEARNPLPKVTTMIDHNNLPEEVVCKDQSVGEQPLPEKLPYLVVVVDEFADLMMSIGKGEVEPPIARLAQKARAAGIHLVLATQRPSVDVITGMIKANFPTRIAFKVTQRVDSRTILDSQGAEYLLGRGDMLVSLNGGSGLKRIQCPFISEEEVDAVTSFLRLQGEPVFDESILANRDEDGDGGDEEDEALSPKDQEIYERCVEMVREHRKCSTSWLQRKMGLGYNKAARFVDRMERTSVVGPPMGAGKDRDVLV